MPVEAVRNWWLNHTWPKEGLSLSAKLSNVARMDDIKSAISTSMRNAEQWTKLARTLTNEGLTNPGVLPAHLKDLESAARRVFAGDTTAMNEYKKALSRSIDAVDALVENGQAGNTLKRAYENILTQAESFSAKALDSSIERAVEAKAQYNAGRIARGEFTKAYNQGELQGALIDGDVIGIRYELSSGHPEEDECDEITGTDAFGLGDGAYPLDNLPDYPFHVGCLCNQSYVYSGEVEPNDEKIRELNEVTDFATIYDRIEIDGITEEQL
jgi:hypothetical protein